MKLNPPNPLDAYVSLMMLEFALGQREYQLRFSPQAKKDEIEFERFPSMIGCFEAHRKPNGLPPTQPEFVVGFETDYRVSRPELFAPDAHAATVARLQKTYPSLVRDLHLFLLCRESKKFATVARGAQLDEQFGVDVLVTDAQQREYYICATAGTQSADAWRTLKHHTRNTFRRERTGLSGTFIELPLTARPKQVIGSWWLYTSAHVAYVAEQIAQRHNPQGPNGTRSSPRR